MSEIPNAEPQTDREKIMRKYGLTDEAAYQKKLERAMSILKITKPEATTFLLSVRRQSVEDAKRG